MNKNGQNNLEYRANADFNNSRKIYQLCIKAVETFHVFQFFNLLILNFKKAPVQQFYMINKKYRFPGKVPRRATADHSRHAIVISKESEFDEYSSRNRARSPMHVDGDESDLHLHPARLSKIRPSDLLWSIQRLGRLL